MSMFVLPGGRRISAEMPFELGDIQYPPNWLKYARPADLGALGIAVEVEMSPPPPAVDLDWLKGDLCRLVDERAEGVRLRYITPGAGMALTYQEKLSQAQIVDGIGKASADALTQAERAAQYPTLSASVGVEAETLWDCAQLVLSKYAEFTQLSGLIEGVRLRAKRAITEAATVEDARAAFNAVAWE